MTDNQKMIRQMQNERISRAQGCLIGQLASDALGSLVEFQSSEQIWRVYQPRPECFWPVDALELAAQLVQA